MNKVVIFSIISAICFGFWPVIARKIGVGESKYLGLIVTLVTCIGIIGYLLVNKSTEKINIEGFGLMALVGLMNLIAYLCYLAVISYPDSSISGIGLLIVGKLTPVFTALAVVWILNGSFTAQQYIGIGFSVIGIFLLIYKS